MIDSKEKLKEYLKYEKEQYNLPDNFRYILKSIANSEQIIIWKFQYLLRKTEYHMNVHNTLRYMFRLRQLNKMRNKYGLHIGLNVFDKGLKIMHLGSILTNGNAKVGKNCAIHINTALVAQGVSSGVPSVGNNVVIGTGATLLGDITIADGIAIGANALVNKSFNEPNIAIAGIPAKKISNNGRSNWNKK